MNCFSLFIFSFVNYIEMNSSELFLHLFYLKKNNILFPISNTQSLKRYPKITTHCLQVHNFAVKTSVKL